MHVQEVLLQSFLAIVALSHLVLLSADVLMLLTSSMYRGPPVMHYARLDCFRPPAYVILTHSESLSSTLCM